MEKGIILQEYQYLNEYYHVPHTGRYQVDGVKMLRICRLVSKVKCVPIVLYLVAALVTVANMTAICL